MERRKENNKKYTQVVEKICKHEAIYMWQEKAGNIALGRKKKQQKSAD